jgi:pimeloyl-ACP methyl ester carboxylesterase
MFVLVHGAGMGASCWDRLLPHLDRPAVAVDLPGRSSTTSPQSTATTWCSSLIRSRVSPSPA